MRRPCQLLHTKNRTDLQEIKESPISRYISTALAERPLYIAILCLAAWLSLAASLWAAPDTSTRTLTTTLDEGTWISVDITTDGSRIVFDLLGDLYTVSLRGGKAVRLTYGRGFDSQPRVSPDGRWVAYLSDASGAENLWVARLGKDAGTPLTDARRLSDENANEAGRVFATPSWSPDSRSILVSRTTGGSRGFEVWRYPLEADDEPEQLTTSDRNLNALGAVVSPNGGDLYYARRRGSFSWRPKLPLWQVIRRNRETEAEQVVTWRPGSGFAPRLSHDGRYLAYATRHDAATGLRLRDLHEGTERWLAYPIQRDDQEARSTRGVVPGYDFTPDDRHIVLSYDGVLWKISVADGSMHEIPFEADVHIPLGPRLHFPRPVHDGPVRAHLAQWPRLSPTGDAVAFSALGRLYVAPLDNRLGVPSSDGPTRLRNDDLVQLTDGEVFASHATWSPDGNQLAYVTWNPYGGHVWIIDADGSAAPRRVSDRAAYYRYPAWTPKGDALITVRASTHGRLEALDGLARPGPQSLVRLELGENTATTRVLGTADGLEWPHFVNDAGRIYLSSRKGLYAVPPEGGTASEVLHVLGQSMAGSSRPSQARIIRMAPDAQHGAAVINKELYVLDLSSLDNNPFRTATLPESPLEIPVEALETFEPDEEGPVPVAVERLDRLGADDLSWDGDGNTLVWSLGSSLFVRSLDGAHETREFKIVIEEPRDRPEGTLVLRGARLITLAGNSPGSAKPDVVEAGVLVVRGNRIIAVGGPELLDDGTLDLPANAQILDLGGKTIVPGFIDIHSHWHELRTDLVDRQAWPFLAALAYGVTASRDPQSRTLDLFLYSDLVATGEILGPRIFTTGPALFSNIPFRSRQEVRNVLTRYRDYYRTHLLKVYTTGDRQLRRWIVDTSHDLGMMPTTEGAMDMKLELTHALDGYSGNEHALPSTPLAEDVIRLMAASKIAYTPTLVLSYGGPLAENHFYAVTDPHADPKLRRFMPHHALDARALRRPWYHEQEHIYPRLAADAAAIARAGGTVCIGGHGQLQGLQVHWEMWALASGGLAPVEVLRAATLNGARAMGYEQDLGSLEPGKLADLVVLDENPLEDIHHTASIHFVMKNGRLYDGNRLDEVWPRQRPLPTQWWWDKDPPVHVHARWHHENSIHPHATAGHYPPTFRAVREAEIVTDPSGGDVR